FVHKDQMIMIFNFTVNSCGHTGAYQYSWRLGTRRLSCPFAPLLGPENFSQFSGFLDHPPQNDQNFSVHLDTRFSLSGSVGIVTAFPATEIKWWGGVCPERQRACDDSGRKSWSDSSLA